MLREEGIRVILVNSNPATIMTDPEFADATYIEPITPEVVEAIIAKERPDAVLATLGGQTALNSAIALHEHGVLEKYDCPLIGANVEAIQLGEDREKFKGVVERCGAESAPLGHLPHDGRVPRRRRATSATRVVVRPSFTMGGLGSGFAHDEADLRRIAGAGPAVLARPPRCSSRSRSLGWKEYELEVMRDHADNVVVVCSIENLDPMGVHTGDSITVAPALTLTDREYQRLRDIGIADHPRGRRRHRRLQHPVRGQPARRPDHRHRDEPARLALVGAGVQGDRLPDRQDRREDGDRLHARRGAQRHHPGDPGHPSSRPSTTSSSRCRGSRSRSSRPPTRP